MNVIERPIESCAARRAIFAGAAAFAAFVLAPSEARGESPEDAFQTWTSVLAQGNPTKTTQVVFDGHLRLYDDFSPFQVLLRIMGGLRLADGMYAGAGYGWTPSFSPEGDFTDEHRAFEQWHFDVPGLGGGTRVYLRTRLEQRFRPAREGVGFRFRQMARAIAPLSPGWPVGLSVWDELFVGLNDAGGEGPWQRAGLDQNRLFFGPSWSASPAFRLEVGYLNHWVFRPDTDAMNHAFMTNAFLSL